MWKRGRNINHIAHKMQQAVDTVHNRTLEWGFRISVEKTKVMLFSRGTINQDLKIITGGKELVRMDHF